MSSLCGIQISAQWALHHCLKYMRMRSNLVPMGTNILEILRERERASAREPKNHVRIFLKEKVFQSPRMTIATKLPAIGVVATIMLLRNVGPLSILSQNTQKYEAHFASQVLETGAMDPIPEGAGPSDNKTPPNEDEGSLNVDDMLVDYASNDIFGDLK